MNEIITKVDVSECEKVDDEIKSTKIYCANCIHCKLVTSPADTSDQFYLRVRCAAGKWRKKMGEEKIHKYFTVSRRSIDFCDSYEDMGETEDFIRNLRKTLPSKDESYDRYNN